MAKREVEKRNNNSETGIEKVLIENFASLQQVMTNLAMKFDNLANQISKLLELFEISAKVLAEKGVIGEEKTDQKVIEKLDSLLEQNKIIAKGIALLHEKDRYPPQLAQRIQYPTQQPTRFPSEFSKNSKLRS
jgi:predicted rRNA methylase YqxC with S4 and FtsJ domains